MSSKDSRQLCAARARDKETSSQELRLLFSTFPFLLQRRDSVNLPWLVIGPSRFGCYSSPRMTYVLWSPALFLLLLWPHDTLSRSTIIRNFAHGCLTSADKGNHGLLNHSPASLPLPSYTRPSDPVVEIRHSPFSTPSIPPTLAPHPLIKTFALNSTSSFSCSVK